MNLLSYVIQVQLLNVYKLKRYAVLEIHHDKLKKRQDLWIICKF